MFNSMNSASIGIASPAIIAAVAVETAKFELAVNNKFDFVIISSTDDKFVPFSADEFSAEFVIEGDAQ